MVAGEKRRRLTSVQPSQQEFNRPVIMLPGDLRY